jgi:hypothetical protein
MTAEQMRATLNQDQPPPQLTPPLAALWWDAKGEWARAHGLVDELGPVNTTRAVATGGNFPEF